MLAAGLTVVIDLHPAARRTIDVVTAVTDEQLALPTPCPRTSVGDLIDHLGIFAVRFVAAARKDSDGRTSPPPPFSAANLEAGWRMRLSHDLSALAEAWDDPQSWEGSTVAAGMEMPAEVVGLVALDELVVHGWDIAAATRHPYEVPADEVDAATAFVSSFEAPRTGELFGPVVPVADDATPLHRLVGLTGRDPTWRPPG